MKAVNKKPFLLVIALALVLSLSAGLTLAYFSDYNAAKGEGTIVLGGQTELHDSYNSDQKTVSIENTGDVPVVVRVAVYAPIITNEEGEEQTVEVNGTDWEKDDGIVGDTAHWYYTKVIEPDESSSTLTVSTTYLEGDLGNTVDIVVTHESCQVAYDANGNVVVPTGWANKIKQ